MKEYNKAVRDGIPEIIRADGKECSVKQVSDEEFLAYMEEKLSEELDEYFATKSVEELADLLEVIYRVAELRGVDSDKLDVIRTKKGEERGRFRENLILLSAQK